MADGTHRKLTAIVSTDVAGYSRLMGVDEAGALQRLNAHRSELIDDLIEIHRGRIVKTTGDGMLLEFPSVVAAVECVVAVQEGMAVRNADVDDDDESIRFRIGAHLGDVIVEGDDIFGDGVNIAARLQEIGEVGGICISDAVNGQIQGRVGVRFEDMGPQDLKNIAAPVRTWRLAVATAPAMLNMGKEKVRPAVAVLPFANMSNDPEQEYFADAITEDVITALSYQRLFPVIARNSTFVYKGQSVDVGEIGRKLNAGYVIEGSVRKAGERVRITAQLIEVATGHHVWAQRYDRELDDIFDLQDEITDALVRAIAPELINFERRKVRSRNPQGMTAWDLYLRGLSAMYADAHEAFEEAEDYARQAIARDPAFGPGHTLLSQAMGFQYFHHAVVQNKDQYEEMMRAARIATELDDRDTIAWAFWGLHLCFYSDHEQALVAGHRAVALNPYAFWPHIALGNAYMTDGQVSESVFEFREALRIGGNDADMRHANTMMLWSQYLLGNYADACIWGRQAAP